MRFVFQKQSRTVVHEVNLCAKRVQCSERNTTERVLQLGNPTQVFRREHSMRNHHTGSGLAPPVHSAPGGCVPFGTLVTSRVAAGGRFLSGMLEDRGDVRRNVPIGTLVVSSPFPVFRRYVPFGTLCKAIGRAQSGRSCVLQSSHFNPYLCQNGQFLLTRPPEYRGLGPLLIVLVPQSDRIRGWAIAGGCRSEGCANWSGVLPGRTPR